MIHVQFAAQQVGDIRPLFDRLGFAIHIRGIATFQTALGAGAVIAKDPQDDGIVGLSLFANRIQQAANLVIGMLGITGVDFRFVRQQLLLLRRQRIPGRQPIRTRGKLGIGGNHAGSLLLGKGFFADLIPPLVELPSVALDPLLRHMMRLMRGPRGEVDEEGLVFGHGIMLMKPVNRFVGDVRRKVIAVLGRLGRLNRRRIAEDARIVLAVGCLIESVEMVEA